MGFKTDTQPKVAFPGLYEELRRLAAVFLEQERPGHTLQPTALVHEAYLRLGERADPPLSNRATFLAAAATAMRRILVDHAKAKKCDKRGGQHRRRYDLDITMFAASSRSIEVVRLDDALDRLAEIEPRLARLVELRFFAGMTEEEAAAVLELSRRTVQVDWRAAKAWLRRELAP